METGGTKNRVFLKWIRSLPADRRKDELQRIVSGGVLNGTSAKSALFKLQKQCFVKLTRLNVLRGAMECARSTTFAASSCPPSPSSLHQPCSSPSPPPSGSKPITAKCRPCPLSRKRPSGTDSSIDTKRRNDASSPKPPQLVATASNLATDGDSRTSLQPADNFSPPLTLSHPNADPVTSTPCPETAVPSTPCPETAVPSTPCPETAVPSTPCPETAVPSTPCPKTVVPSTPCPETVVPSTPCLETAVPSRPCLEAVVPSSANAVPSIHCQPPSLPQQVQSSEQPAQSRAESMKQRMSTSEQQTSRVHLTPRVISEALRDVAMSLCAVELEMAKLDQELLAFEKLPPSHKNSRRLNALVESCTLLMMKAGSIKSCIDRGVAAKLGGSFYPTLLAEVNKIPKLALYSNLRLMTMVNILLQLSEPTCDPKYIVNAFISNNYSEWRPEENTENSLTEPKLTTTSSSRLPVGSSQTPNAQTTSKPPSKAEAAGIVRSEVTPKPPTEMKKQSAMHNAGGPRQEQQSLRHIPTPQPKPMTQCLPQSNQGVPHQPQWILQSAVPQQTHMQTGGPHSRKVYANPNVHNQSHSRVKNNVPNQPQAMGPHISNPNQALVQPNVQHVPHHLQCQPPMRTGVPSQPQVSRQSAAPNHPEMTWQSAAPNQPQMTRHPAAPNQHQVMNPQMANSQVLYLRLPENMQPVQNPQVNTQLATQISSPSHVPRGFVPNASNGYIPATNGSVQQNRQSTFNPPVYPGNVPANDSTLLNYRRQQAQCGQGQQAQTMSLPVGGQPGPQPFQTQPLTHSHNDVGVGQRQNMQHNALSFTQDAQTLTLLLTQQYVANAALYNGSNLQLQSQGLTQEFMTRPGQDQAYQVVEQRSPVARTTSRDSGIATPEPAIYEDPSFRGGAATSALYKNHYQ